MAIGQRDFQLFPAAAGGRGSSGGSLMWQPASSAHVKAVMHQWIVNVAVIIVASSRRFAVKPFRCTGGAFCLVPPFVAALLVAGATVNN